MKTSCSKWSRLAQPSGKVKTPRAWHEISGQTQAPILEAWPVVLDCQVDRIIEEDGICHILPRFSSDWLIRTLRWQGHLKIATLRLLTLWGRSPACLSLSVRPSRSHEALSKSGKDDRTELPNRSGERLVLRYVQWMLRISLVCQSSSLLPNRFPVKTLKNEIYYLEHILPERNQG